MFEKQPDPQLEKLIGQMQTMIELQMALLKKLEQQQTMLTALAKFVHSNSSDTPSFSIG